MQGGEVADVDGRPIAAVDLLEKEAAEVASTWDELCQWDPVLPPDSHPPMAEAVVLAVGRALVRPQPLGWGIDPELEPVTDGFAVAAGSIDVAVGQLVCLREALRLHLRGRVPPEEEQETLSRMNMVIDRAIGVTARRMVTRLEAEAHIDPLTGLLNRRALGRDLERELGRAARHGRPLTVIVADLDGLKLVNDTAGHAAGDNLLRAMGAGLRDAMRVGDAAYRVGGDEFVVMLPEATAETAAAVARRVEESGAPAFTWGAASYPEDGAEPEMLLDRADRRLLDKRDR